MHTKVLVARKMNAPADMAWRAIETFGRLNVWFPGILSCRVEGEGVGAHRYLGLEHGEIVDRLESMDHRARRLVYKRIKSPFPVSSYTGTVEVMESFDRLAVVVWTVDFESRPEDSATVAAMLEAGIGAGVEGMAAELSAAARGAQK